MRTPLTRALCNLHVASAVAELGKRNMSTTPKLECEKQARPSRRDYL